MARLNWYLDPSSPHQTKKKVGPPLTKLSGSAHVKKMKPHDLSGQRFLSLYYLEPCPDISLTEAPILVIKFRFR